MIEFDDHRPPLDPRTVTHEEIDFQDRSFCYVVQSDGSGYVYENRFEDAEVIYFGPEGMTNEDH